jgi:histidinol-phosphate aminotransferase
MPYLWTAKQPYNVSVTASTAAIAALRHADQLEEIGQKIIAERERLYAELQKIDYLQPYPSQSNFILCRVIGRDAKKLKEDLAQKGILIRYFNKPGLTDHIRISVGTREQVDALLEFLIGY